MPGVAGYSVYLQGYLVLCSAEGLTSGACEATIIQYGGATLPLARTVNGQLLTSAEPIESAADAGLVVLLNAGSPFLGTIGRGR